MSRIQRSKIENVVNSLVEYLDLESYGIDWNEGERSIPQIWAIYPPRRFVHFALLSLYEFVATNFTKNMVVLDFGCGVGYGAYRLAVRGASFVHGIDLDEKAIKFGRHHFRCENVKIEIINIHELANNKENLGIYDFIYCSNVMEHIEDYYRVLCDIHRLLKPGGQYFHVTPPSGKAKGNPFHITNFTIPEWRKILLPLFPNQRYFAMIPTRSREEIISEYEFNYTECGPCDMSILKSIGGIILARKSYNSL